MADSPMFDAIARQGRLIRKELLEILRDRRTIVTLVLMPLLIYPLLGVGFMQFARALAPQKDPVFYVAAEDPEALDRFARLEAHFRENFKAKPGAKPPQWKFYEANSVDAALRDNAIDIALSLEPAEGPGQPVVLRATYSRKSSAGPLAAQWVERMVHFANDETLDEFLKRQPPEQKRPAVRYEVQRVVLAGGEGDGLVSLTSVIPFILILMTITGAVYPAIDLTAGERERGTLEVLVAAPVPRINLLVAKYAAVVFVAMLTAIVNLIGMTATLVFNPLGQALLGGGLTFALVGQLLALLMLFAAFFSAVLLTITSFARSFKEAQAYLIPVMLFSLAPGAVGLIPDLKLTPLWAVTPLVNIVLLGRDLLEGKAEIGLVVLVIVATILYAVAALSLASRVFGAEAVLYNERNSWGDLFRRPLVGQAEASVSSVFWSLALLVPTYYVAQGLSKVGVDAGIVPRPQDAPGFWMGFAAVLAAALFVGWPALFSWHERTAWRTGFGLHGAPVPAWPAALLLGGSVGILEMPLLAWLSVAPPDELRAAVDQIAGQMRDGRWVLISYIVQALVEELFFRGYFWEALERRAGVFWTIVLTSFFFGLAHVVMGGIFGLERLFPSTSLGLLLGVVRWRTRSVVPGMILHALHNTTMVLLLQSPTTREWNGLPPMTWLMGAGALAAVGLGLLMICRPVESSRHAPTL